MVGKTPYRSNKRNKRSKAAKKWRLDKMNDASAIIELSNTDVIEIQVEQTEPADVMKLCSESLTTEDSPQNLNFIIKDNDSTSPKFQTTDELMASNLTWCTNKYDGKSFQMKKFFSNKAFISAQEYQSINNVQLEVETEQKETSVLSGYRIVELDYVLNWAITLQHDHSKICTSGKLYIKEERRRSLGLVSQIVYGCTMCPKIFKFATENPNKPAVLNKAAVWGVMSTGSCYSHLDELLSSMDIPNMSEKMFYDIENKLGEDWKKSLWDSMIAAGKKERDYAISIGCVDEDNIPCITVSLDGSWSKRSYGNNFNSLSGMFAVIGRHTDEVLFISVRNRYCSICALAANNSTPPKPHHCFKNWLYSAPAMEADMAVEGFCVSEEMHGVRFTKFIGDGDSSVYLKLKENVPYGNQIKKIECTNHALKNYGKRLRQIKKDTHINLKGRKLLTLKKIGLLQKRAKCSIYEHSKTEDRTSALDQLRKDLESGINHVFGDHSKCRVNICNSLGDQSQNQVPELKETNIYFHINGAIDLLIRKAHLLLENENNNRCEQLMNIVARFNMGKRLNLVQRGSYERRVHLAALRYNDSFSWHERSWIAATNTKPGKYFQRFIDKNYNHALRKSRKRHLGNINEEQSPSKRKKVISNSSQLSIDYGPHALQPPEDVEIMNMEIERIIENLQVDTNERDRIEASSKHQFEDSSGTYHCERKKRMTASLFGKVIKRKAHTSCHGIVKACLRPYVFTSHATEYGIAKEKVAIQLFESKTGFKVQKSGLWVDLEYGFLGASPDGLIPELEAIVEVKSIFSASKLVCPTMNDLLTEMKKKKKSICLEVKGKKIQLKRKHLYYYQIQGQLNVTQFKKCYFVVYVNDHIPIYIEEIERDEQLCKNEMVPNLQSFYKDCIAPELVRDNMSKGLRCLDPPYILEAQKIYNEKQARKKKP